MQTTVTLIPSTIEKIQELIGINIDSCKGLEHAADTVESERIASTLRIFARQRGQNAAELQKHVRFSGETPATEGTVGGTLRRWWLGVRGALNGGDDHVVLIEAERAEDATKCRYEEVLPETAGSALHDVLLRQYREIRAGHDRIRQLRDSSR
jgi:uncharacterized protein (TIGR02284 family)